jgi:hypothetical protein
MVGEIQLAAWFLCVRGAHVQTRYTAGRRCTDCMIPMWHMTLLLPAQALTPPPPYCESPKATTTSKPPASEHKCPTTSQAAPQAHCDSSVAAHPASVTALTRGRVCPSACGGVQGSRHSLRHTHCPTGSSHGEQTCSSSSSNHCCGTTHQELACLVTLKLSMTVKGLGD